MSSNLYLTLVETVGLRIKIINVSLA